MYNLQKNNYHQKPKSSTIYTPPAVSQFIFELLRDKIPKDRLIFDPCCGMGSLLEPWKKVGYRIGGNDINVAFWNSDLVTWCRDFLEDWTLNLLPQLILCNPPFNGYGNKLGSEVWLDKIIELSGKEVPIVLFAPVGFRLNLTTKSSRWLKFSNEKFPPISSIIALPKNIFEGVIFHSEILIFNIPGLKGHYFLPKYEM